MGNTTVALDLCACFKVVIDPQQNRDLRYSLAQLTAPIAPDEPGHVTRAPITIAIPRSDIQIIHALPPAPKSPPASTDEALEILQDRFDHALHLKLIAATLRANLALNPADETSARIATLLAAAPLTWVSGPHYEFLVTNAQADIARSVPALSVDAQTIMRIPEVDEQNPIVDTSPIQRPLTLPAPRIALEAITDFRPLPPEYATELAATFQTLTDRKKIQPQDIKTMLLLGERCRVIVRDEASRIGQIVNSWKQPVPPAISRLN